MEGLYPSVKIEIPRLRVISWMGLRIGVFSDTHVGRNIPRVLGDARRKAFRHAFKQAVTVFVREKVDYVLHGGDLFEKRSMTPEDAVFVKEELYRLVKESGKNVEIIAVRGNHDGSPTSSALDFVTHPVADYFHVLGDKTLEGREEVFWDGNLRVAAIGYHPYAKGKFRELAELVSSTLSREGFKILLIHNYVEGVHDIPPSTPEHAVAEAEKVEEMGADLVISGHHHEHLGLKRVNGQLYLLPGSTEAVDLGERGPFGVYILEVEDGRLASHRFIELTPLQLIESRSIVSEKPLPLEWYRRRCLEEAESFAGGLEEKGVDGILRLQVRGVVVEPGLLPELGLEEELRDLRKRYPRLLHVEVLEELEPILGGGEEALIEADAPREEVVRRVFEELGEAAVEAAELVEEVAMSLEERASERTGLLKDSDRARFVERWGRLMLKVVGGEKG